MARYEGSPADEAEDQRNARKLGMSLKAYEKSPMDKAADREGQRKLDAKAHIPGPGRPASQSKFAHGKPRTY